MCFRIYPLISKLEYPIHTFKDTKIYFVASFVFGLLSFPKGFFISGIGNWASNFVHLTTALYLESATSSADFYSEHYLYSLTFMTCIL